MANLVAYIPVLNYRHIEWFRKHSNSSLHLISQEMAESLLPRLSRNMVAVPTGITAKSIIANELCRRVCDFNSKIGFFAGREFILPDEDISHLVAERYLLDSISHFERIWSRWDMTAVKASQPIISDCEISLDETDFSRIFQSNQISQRSPDWWRQVGIIAFREDRLLACGWNEHFPTEYETGIFGDPRLNFDAGDPSGMDAYVSLHAEEYLIAFCSREGISLEGASLYINTFPCGRCARALSLTGVKELFFGEGYSFLKGFDVLSSKGIRIVHVKDPRSA
ncbi:MAG: hypothetical protein WC095_01280 [Candidatus Paceibacterota bacterium]